MNCQQYEELMMKYFDRIANDFEIEALIQHLKQCSQCSNQFEQLKNILCTLEKNTEIELPTDLESEVMQNINQYVISNEKSLGKLNGLLVAIMAIILSIPLVIVNENFANISIYKILMGLLPKLSLISDSLVSVVGTVKFITGFLPLKDELFYGGLYLVVVMIFIAGLISRRIFVGIKHKNV